MEFPLRMVGAYGAKWNALANGSKSVPDGA